MLSCLVLRGKVKTKKRQAGRGDRTLDLPLTKRLPCHLAIPAVGTGKRIYDKQKLRQPGVEPGAKAWEASMLPIHHWRCVEKEVEKQGFDPCACRLRTDRSTE